jgi:hypothetical protein
VPYPPLEDGVDLLLASSDNGYVNYSFDGNLFGLYVRLKPLLVA